MKRRITLIILLSVCQLSCISHAQKNQAATINDNGNLQATQPSNVSGPPLNSNSANRSTPSDSRSDPLIPSDPIGEATSEQLEKAIPEKLRKQIACTIEETVTVTPNGGGPAPLTVAFNASESTAPCGKIVKWTWKFGDGRIGSGAKLAHTYQKPGSYKVTVEMRDSKGNRNDLVIEYAIAVN